MEEKELFEDYEMRSWEFTPRVYKILGIAALANFLFLFAFGQFNLLTTRGCDTPYAGIVCQVLDSAYVASTFLGEDFKADSRPYTKDEIGDADITYIDVSEKLEYPAGYFALANPEQTSENNGDSFNDIAGLPNPNNSSSPLNTVPSSTDSGMMDKPSVTPTPNKKLEEQDEVTSPFEVAGNNPKPNYPRITPSKTPRITKAPKLSNESPTSLGGNTVATNKTPQPTPTPTPSEEDRNKAKDDFTKGFNKLPLQELADGILAKTDSTDPKAKIDLKQSFTVVMDGVLTKEGKLDTKKSAFVKREGSEEMINVAKDSIEAVNNSGLLKYLLDEKNPKNVKINFAFSQNDENLTAVIRVDKENEAMARTFSSGFKLLIDIAKLNVKEEEVQTLMKAAKFSSEGKSFILNFSIPKTDAHKMIDQKLQEARQKKSQPNSGESVKESSTAKGK